MLDHLTNQFERVEAMQQQLVARATGGGGDNALYVLLRRELLDDPTVASRLPRYVRTCGDLEQFWRWIKPERATYAARQELIWGDFRPILDHLGTV